MFALAIELLTGRYVATAYNDRDSAEWPPHPARLFSALTATWADGEPETPEGQEELAALHWLEQLPPPVIYASATKFSGPRDVVPVFVPVNDASVVSTPDRSKLDAAIAELESATDSKARAKAGKEVAKLKAKLAENTQRAIAAPTKLGKSDASVGARLLPEWRVRQPRTFPGSTPEEPTVVFSWESPTPTTAQNHAFERLAARFVRLGHSSTLAALRVVSESEVKDIAARTIPFTPNGTYGDLMTRWVGPGQTARLSEAFAMHKETEPRVLPGRFVRYSEGGLEPQAGPPGSHFDDDFIVFSRVGGPRLSTLSTAGISQQLRRALMAAADQPVSSLLSGHQPNGGPLDRPHLAVVPLPSVGHQHSDGAILGVALIFPRDSDLTERRAVLKAVGQLEPEEDEIPTIKLLLGTTGELELERIAWGQSSRKTLRPSYWTRASELWATATPVALDRNPGDLHAYDPQKRQAAFDAATDTIRTALHHVAPDAARLLTAVDVVRSCVLPGSAKPRNFPRFPANHARTQRVLVHVRLAFSKPIRGPLLLGAGRYQGLGLFLPVGTSTRAAELEADL